MAERTYGGYTLAQLREAPRRNKTDSLLIAFADLLAAAEEAQRLRERTLDEALAKITAISLRDDCRDRGLVGYNMAVEDIVGIIEQLKERKE